MFLYQSNRLELLCDALCEVIARPLAAPLAPEIIVVQNQGMAVWLKQQLAARLGIAANLVFPLTGRFLWDIVALHVDPLPEENSFAREVLLWRIYALLPGQEDDPSLHRYLERDRNGRKRYQMASRIADLFDQYQVYRPDMLSSWEKGADSHWQAVLWRQLTSATPQSRNRLFSTFLQASGQSSPAPVNLPERASLFGINALPPLYLDTLHAASTRLDIHLFHLSPCREFWTDITAERELAKKRREWMKKNQPDLSAYHESGNPLLASLGGLGRSFGMQLLELEELREQEMYQAAPETCLLARVQNDLLDLRPPNAGTAPRHSLPDNDSSLQFHSCHSRVREVQVLHDQLLGLFTTVPGLRPSDILVMAPDISAYAAAIQGTFGGAPAERHIPWALADRPVRDEQPLLAAFVHLLQLLSGRFTASEVLRLWDCPALLDRFGLHESDRPLCQAWMREAGIRWGLSAAHRHELGLDTGDQHTWRRGLDRLLLGSIMDSDQALFQGYAPVSVTGSDVAVLGAMADLIDSLDAWRQKLAQPHPPAAWHDLLQELAGAFFSQQTDEDSILALQQVIADFSAACGQAGCGELLDLELIREHFALQTEAAGSSRAFLSGRVTFCNMVPMRSLPFQVICLLGMEYGAFPRNQHRPEFDLMAVTGRIGDRNRREDDRYLFLEALVSARQTLYISWTGRSQADNSPRPPSVVVDELLGYLSGYDDGADGRARIVEHPLQPFSPRCFLPGSPSLSYAGEWMPAQERQQDAGILSTPLPPPEPGPLDLAELERFWKSPVAYFLKNRLNVSPSLYHDPPADSEPFSLNALELYPLADRVTDMLIRGEDPDRLYLHLYAEGALPRRGFAHSEIEQTARIGSEIASQLDRLGGEALPPVEIHRAFGMTTLHGLLDRLTPRGRITWRPAKLKASDLLQLWVHHLALNLERPGGIELKSVHVGRDGCYSLQPVNDPVPHLERMVELFCEGQRAPLEFYPETSHAWASAGPDKAARKAEDTWKGTSYRHGESRNAAYRFLPKDRPILTDRFVAVAEAVFHPIYEHLEG